MNYAQTFLMTNMNAFPAEAIPVIQKELEDLDEQSVNALLMTDIKNPTIALLLSLFVGAWGVDRFYVGNKGLGIAKLALTIFSFLTLFILIGFFLLLVVSIWAIVDCFLIMGACKKGNFERLMFQINQAKMFRQMSQPAKPVVEPVLVSAEEPSMEEVPVVVETMEGPIQAEVAIETVEIAQEEVLEVAQEEVSTEVIAEEVSESEEVPFVVETMEIPAEEASEASEQ